MTHVVNVVDREPTKSLNGEIYPTNKADESGHLPLDAESVSERRRYSRLLLKLIERWREAAQATGQSGRGEGEAADQGGNSIDI